MKAGRCATVAFCRAETESVASTSSGIDIDEFSPFCSSDCIGSFSSGIFSVLNTDWPSSISLYNLSAETPE